MTDVKHGGCAICGSKYQEILKSITVPGQSMGKAVCEDCRKKGVK